MSGQAKRGALYVLLAAAAVVLGGAAGLIPALLGASRFVDAFVSSMVAIWLWKAACWWMRTWPQRSP